MQFHTCNVNKYYYNVVWYSHLVLKCINVDSERYALVWLKLEAL